MKSPRSQASVSMLMSIAVYCCCLFGCAGERVVEDHYFGLRAAPESLHYQRLVMNNRTGRVVGVLRDFRWYRPSMGGPDDTFTVRSRTATGAVHDTVYGPDCQHGTRFVVAGDSTDLDDNRDHIPPALTQEEVSALVANAHAEVLRRQGHGSLDWYRPRPGCLTVTPTGRLLCCPIAELELPTSLHDFGGAHEPSC